MSRSSLWLCLHLPRLALDALLDAGEHTVVFAQKGSRRWVLASADRRIGAGEALGSVQARFPEVQVRPRDSAAEAAALQAVACLAYRLGDRIVITDEAPRAVFDSAFQAVSVDIGPSLRMLGGLDAALAQAQKLFAESPYQVRMGVAPTIDAAAVAARAELPPIAGDSAALAAALAPLPLAVLRWPAEALDTLRSSGHRLLADLRRHDAAGLASRLGPAIPTAIARLYGHLPDPRPLFEPPHRFRRAFDMDAEIDDWQALLFPMKRLFDELEAYLEARQLAVSEVIVLLSRHRGEAERFVLRTTRPTQQAAILLRLLRERWNARSPTRPATMIRVQAGRFAERQVRQPDLFTGINRDGEVWNDLIDRLRARLGDDAVWQPGLVSDHRPEHAWARNGADAAPATLPPRPLWLLHKPRRIAMPTRLVSMPERIVGGWWDAQATERDYHRVTGEHGEKLWIYRDFNDDRWYLHGYWD